MALITNAGGAISFGTVASGQTVTVTNFSVTLVDGSLDNVVLCSGSLAANRTLVQGDPISFPQNDLDINIPAGTLNDAGLAVILQAGLDQYTGGSGATVRLGTGSMGTGGTGNEVPGNTGYTAQTGVDLDAEES